MDLPYYREYYVECHNDIFPLDRLAPPQSSPCIEIRLHKRSYNNGVLEQYSISVKVFPFRHEVLFYDDTIRYFLSRCLSRMGIPLGNEQEPVIQSIISFYQSMSTDPSSSSIFIGGEIEIPIVIADIFMDTWFVGYDENDQANITRVMEDSMENDELKPVPASKSSIEEALEKVRVEEGLDSREKCAICLETHHVGEEVSRMPCSHIYHEDCIVQWLKTSHHCPLCRYKIPTDFCLP